MAASAGGLVPTRLRRNYGRSSSAGIFVGGFVFGGIIVGAIGCVYAPQISKALAEANRRELMSRLPKLIYDEEKALEVRRLVGNCCVFQILPPL